MAYKNIEEQRAKNRQHYQENKQYYLDKNKKKVQLCKDYVVEFKESNPCTDCGQFYPACVMDFDHKDRTTKVGNVSRLICGGTLSRVQAEINKCDLVCANCHRIRTYLIPS